MKNELKAFTNSEFGELELLIIDGKEYFPATNCAKMLGYTNPQKAIKDHCRYLTKRSVPHPQNVDKTIEMNFIPEGDLFRLITKSKLPSAENFEKWVFDEVLPSIRKTGGYVSNDELFIDTYLPFADDTTKALFRGTLEMVKKQNEAIQVMQPKAEYYDKVLDSESEITTSQIAKDCFMSAKQLNLILSHKKIQYKQNGQWLLYANYQDKGYTKTRTKPYIDSNGIQQTKRYTVWTEKGREFIMDLVDDL